MDKPEGWLNKLGAWIEKWRVPIGIGLIVLILCSGGILILRLDGKGDQGELGEVQNRIENIESRIEKLESSNQSSVVSNQVNATTPTTAPEPATAGKVAGATTAGLININTATLAELDTLPSIGPVTAQKIIDYRTKNGNFKTTEDVIKVSGIGPKTFEKFKDKITVN